MDENTLARARRAARQFAKALDRATRRAVKARAKASRRAAKGLSPSPVGDEANPDATDAPAVDWSRMESQAERVVRLFGGHKVLHRILADMGRPRSLTSIYKWAYPRERDGSNGRIPTSALGDVLDAAMHDRIVLSAKDLDPRPQLYDPPESPWEAKLAAQAAEEIELKALAKEQGFKYETPKERRNRREREWRAANKNTEEGKAFREKRKFFCNRHRANRKVDAALEAVRKKDKNNE